MISDNIKRIRKAKWISQKEMAAGLNVVRQTVSKWENGLSVPDTDVLIDMANLLGVTINQLLGLEEENNRNENLSMELARLKEQLEKQDQKEKLQLQVSRKRSFILALSFLTLVIALSVKNDLVSIILVGGCMLMATAILYRNLSLFTSVKSDDGRVGIMRITVIFNTVILVIGIVVAFLNESNVITFSENGEKTFAMIFVSCIMIFAGIVCPKLPYNRYIGLRLLWTVQDEDTWNIAHRILGYISIPVVLIYIACTWTIQDFKAVSVAIMITWIGIPGGISYVHFHKKYHGKM